MQMPYLHSCAKVVPAFLLLVFRGLWRRCDFVNSFFFFPLHICIGEGEHSPVAVPLGIDMSQIVNCATTKFTPMCGPGGPVISFLSRGAECAWRVDGSDFSHLRAAGESGGCRRCNPSAKVLKCSVGRQEMANCISFESFIKENAKCVELSLLYIQLQSTRCTGSAWRNHKLANIAKHTLAAPSNLRLVPADTGSLVEQSAGTHKSK